MAKRRNEPNTKLAGEFVRLMRLRRNGTKDILEGTFSRFEGKYLIVLVGGLEFPVRIGGTNGYVPLQFGTPNMESHHTVLELRYGSESKSGDVCTKQPSPVEEKETVLEIASKEEGDDFDLDKFREDFACPEEENELAFLDPFGSGFSHGVGSIGVEEY